MIEAKDLRIGNCFDYNGQTVYVLNIFKDGKVDFGYFEDSVGFLRRLTDEDCPKPIELTEEWFLSFGFKKGNGFFFKGKFIIHYDNHDGFNFKYDDHLLRRLKHVHHLQNLYFVLDGEELTTKQ